MKLVKRKPFKLLKPDTSKTGYQRFTIWYNKINGKHANSKRFLVHRVVAELFIPNPLKLPQVNHIDNNPSNNDVANLEWVTPGQNLSHAYRTNRRSAVGSKNNLSKLTESDVVEIRRLASETSLYHREIAAIFGVSQSLITMVINNRIWTHV